MSETNFRRRFRQTLGCAPLEFLTGIRLAAAQKLLETTDRGIADIAQETGFCDHAHFIRVFRARRKTTPGDYRRRHQKRQR
jgi:AraC family transcriptional regulator